MPARAYRQAALMLTQDTFTRIPLDTVDAGDDPGGTVVPTQYFGGTSAQLATNGGKYKCPYAGVYHVSSVVTAFNNAGGLPYLFSAIYHNDTWGSQAEAIVDTPSEPLVAGDLSAITFSGASLVSNVSTITGVGFNPLAVVANVVDVGGFGILVALGTSNYSSSAGGKFDVVGRAASSTSGANVFIHWIAFGGSGGGGSGSRDVSSVASTLITAAQGDTIDLYGFAGTADMPLVPGRTFASMSVQLVG